MFESLKQARAYKSSPAWSTDLFNRGYSGLNDSGSVYGLMQAYTSTSFACINQIAIDGAKIEYDGFDKENDEEVIRPQDDPINILLDNPNPEMSAMVFKMLIFKYLCFSGKAYIRKIFKGRRVIALKILLLNRLTPFYSAGKVEYYSYNDIDGTQYNLSVEEVIAIINPSMLNPNIGEGDLQSVVFAAETIRKIYEAMRTYFDNGMLQGLYFSTDEVMEPNRFKKFYDSLIEKYTESISRKGYNSKVALPVVTHSGIKPQAVTQDMRTILMVDTIKQLDEEIFTGFRMSPSIIGRNNNLPRASVYAQKLNYWDNCILPKAHLVADCLTLGLSHHFVGYPIVSFKDKPPTDMQDTASVGVLYMQAGAHTINELRKLYSLSELPNEPLANVPIKFLDLPNYTPAPATVERALKPERYMGDPQGQEYVDAAQAEQQLTKLLNGARIKTNGHSLLA